MKWIFFLAILAFGEDCVQVGKQEFGRLKVIARDFTGATLPGPRVELIEMGSKQGFDIQKPVPYGNYMMTLIIPGFQMIQREVRVYQPTVVVRAEFSLRGECAGPESIHGRLRSSPKHELFVKVVPVLGTGGGESLVGPNGDFLIDGLDFGNYLLIVLDGNNAVHTETVIANARKSITIEL